MRKQMLLRCPWSTRVRLGVKLVMLIGIAIMICAPFPAAGGTLTVAAAFSGKTSDATTGPGATQTRAIALRHGPRPAQKTNEFNIQQIDSRLYGTVSRPDGTPLTSASSPNPDAIVYAINADGTYTAGLLDSNGNYTIDLAADFYEIWMWLNQAAYPDLSAPDSFQVSVSGDTVAPIQLLNRGAANVIHGSVKDNLGAAVQNIEISAWRPDGAQFYTTTDSSGAYTMTVTSGTWWVAPDLSSSTQYVYKGDPIISQQPESSATPVNFSLDPVPVTIVGTVKNKNDNTKVTDIQGWAYVKLDGNILNYVPIISGTFNLPSPSPNPLVGVYLDPNSNYTAGDEVTAVPQSSVTSTADILVQPQEAEVVGRLYNPENPLANVANLNGYVILSAVGPSAIVKYAKINTTDGTYSLHIAPGEWLITYQIDSTIYQADLDIPQPLTATSNVQYGFDLPLVSLDGQVVTTVLDEAGNPQPNITVWVRYGDEQEIYKQTDKDGKVKIYVPFDNSALTRGGVVRPQGAQQPPITMGTSHNSCAGAKKPKDPTSPGKKCGISSKVALQQAKPKTPGMIGLAAADSTQLNLREPNGTLTGRVLKDGKGVGAGAFISAWSKDAQWISGETDENGAFSLPVVQDAAISNTWQISASYLDIAGKHILYASTSKIVNQGQAPGTPIAAGDLNLAQVSAAPPAGEDQRFINSNGVSLRLSDGTLIQVPRNAVSTASEAQLRIKADPKIELPSTDLSRLANYFGYAINFYDAQTNKPITGALTQNATITFQYTDAQLKQLGVTEDKLRAAQFVDDTWEVADGFILDTAAKTVSVETTSLDNWALVGEQAVSAASGGRTFIPLAIRK